ncbi:ABC transporter ATP-binding protein [Allofournierella massiliensis]|uniref:ABC transporter ATP-binding protein n=1 Tax=Allofournierella massiliensis TaxID=1650663 RepID=UPI0024B11A90|nr:ABC transporter ATP-binding protein [Fournierella massiliensis]
MSTPVVEVNNVTMRFNLAEEKTDTVKEYFVKLVKGQLHFNEFLALKNVSFTVNRGESVALIGKNGSGKSTMLKIIAGVMYPSEGQIKINGSIAPLIELGAGFDMDLTARENIYLNGAVMGMDRQFMNQHFDEIIEFAELQDFVDVPIKNYSSGMVSRLGFAIATVVRADILVVDEVLAVGDFKFQEKCKQKMQELLAGGTTLLFVSHSGSQVKELCSRAIWLEHGVVMADGDATEVYEQYEKKMEQNG